MARKIGAASARRLGSAFAYFWWSLWGANPSVPHHYEPVHFSRFLNTCFRPLTSALQPPCVVPKACSGLFSATDISFVTAHTCIWGVLVAKGLSRVSVPTPAIVPAIWGVLVAKGLSRVSVPTPAIVPAIWGVLVAKGLSACYRKRARACFRPLTSAL